MTERKRGLALRSAVFTATSMIAIPIGLFLTVVTLELCINSPGYAGVTTTYVGGMSLASFGTLGSGVWLLRHRKD